MFLLRRLREGRGLYAIRGEVNLETRLEGDEAGNGSSAERGMLLYMLHSWVLEKS